MLAATLLQAAADTFRVTDVLQAVTAAGMVAGAGFLWKVATRLTAIETSLNHPEMGAMPSITSLRKSRHNDATTLQAHETRLDGHDRDISRIDGLIGDLPERRAATHEGKPYDRRST